MKITAEQVAKYKAMHIENADMLLSIVDGHVDPTNPEKIEHPDASCLVARVIDNNTKMLGIINDVEAT